MFDFDSLREIGATVSKNKMRTFLTSLAVAWGIFMLVILLGVGNGFKNAAMSNFSGRARNTVTLWPGWTSMPYNGLPTSRRIRFDSKDLSLLKNKFPEMEYLSAEINQLVTMSYDNEYGNWNLNGVFPDAEHISMLKIEQGRFINELDMQAKRKVIVITPEIQKVLFKDESPLGKFVQANGIAYQVVGVSVSENQFNNSMPAYMPFSVAQLLYNKGYGFDKIDFTVNGLKTTEQNEAFVERLRGEMGKLHGFNPEDRSALYVWNSAGDAVQAENIFWIINAFVLIIGIASLMAGIVGVGNIMLITVKERTKEIGIRKAIGATPVSVLKLIIFESIIITTVAGYIGMIFGLAVIEIIDFVTSMAATSGSPTMLKDVSISLTTAILAILSLVVCGMVAGLIPAMKATRVSPIEAMRAE